MEQITIQDKIFGELSWEAAMDWWIGQFEYNPGHQIWVHVYAEDSSDYAALNAAHELFFKIRQTEFSLREFAFTKSKESYFEQHLKTISANEFCQNLGVESLTFRGETGGDIAFDDGQMFGGHIIIVSVDKTGTPLDAELAG